MSPWELQPSLWTEKITSRGPSAVPASVIGISQHVGTRFGLLQPHYTKGQCKQEPTTGPQTCLTTKNLNKYSIDKLCLMTVPPIGQQRAERNRTKALSRCGVVYIFRCFLQRNPLQCPINYSWLVAQSLSKW